MKNAILGLLLLLTTATFAQNYIVQVAAYNQKVPLSYFKGLNGVFTDYDNNGIFKYYVGNIKNIEEGNSVVTTAKSLGFEHARVIDLDEQNRKCALSCGKPVIKVQTTDLQSLKSIFFGFDSAVLRAESKTELNKLYNILVQNPSYTTLLSAHTDSKGSNDYNKALSLRRANAAKNYLIGRGISSARIKSATSGESKPIAKNETATGADTELGRQLNRRVELLVKDANGQTLNITEEIEVPNYLK